MWSGFRMTRSGLDAMPAPIRPLLWTRIEMLQQLAAIEVSDDSDDVESEQPINGEEIVEEEDDEMEETDDENADDEDDEMEETDDEDDEMEGLDGGVIEVMKSLTQQDLDSGIHFAANEFLSEIYPQWLEVDNLEVRVYNFRSDDLNNFTDFMMRLRRVGDTYVLGNKSNDPENWFLTNFSNPNRLSAGDRVYVSTHIQAPFLRISIMHVLNLLNDPVPVPPLAPNGPYFLGWEIVKVLRRIDIEETFWIYEDHCPVHMRDPNPNQFEINVRDLQHTPVLPVFMTVERVGGYIVFNEAQWQARFVQRNNLEVGNTVGLYWDEAMECFVFARLAE